MAEERRRYPLPRPRPEDSIVGLGHPVEQAIPGPQHVRHQGDPLRGESSSPPPNFAVRFPYNCNLGIAWCQKWYAVRLGRVPRIYLMWEEAEPQVDGFSGARHKSFQSREEVET